jgi:hypothetical protein
MADRVPLRRGISVAVASAAVVLGHRLAYLAAFPDATAREAALRASGHGYLGFLTDVAILLAGAAAAGAFLSRLTRSGGRVPSLGGLSARLATLQSVAFVTMEVTERVASGAPVGSVLTHHLLPIGIAVQALGAVVATLLIRAVLSAADQVAKRARAATTPLPSPTARLASWPVAAPFHRLPRQAAARAPPSASF